MKEKNTSYISGQIIFMILVFIMVNPGWAQNHDLVMKPAPNITSVDPANWKSPDLKVGTDFDIDFPPNIIRRGVANPIYTRFRINGVEDYLVPSGSVDIQFHYRVATIGEEPPDLDDPSWSPIGTLTVTYDESTDGPFAITRVWPTDFPSVPTTNKFVSWDAPEAGDYFHIRAEVVYTNGTEDEQPGDNVAISLYESILGLRDIDLVLVHDVSGSMLSYKFDGTSYIDHAKSKASCFILSMNEDHRVAVVAFGDCLTGGRADIWPTPVASLQEATLPNKNNIVAAIMTDVTVPSISCMTPMGAGLERAIEILTAGPLDADRKRVILLLSDGYENTGSPRACPPSYPTGTCVGGDILTQLQDNNIRVFAIALGEYAWFDCLECLAEQSGGEWYETPNPGCDLAEVYLDMQEAYSEDDLYRVDRGISGGGDDAYETFFEGLDEVLYFVLAWDDLNVDLDLELQPPGNAWCSPNGLSNASVYEDKGYVVVRVENPAQGTWGYRVTGAEGENYLVAVRSDRVGVRMEMDVKSIGKVGEPIRIQAYLTDLGRPIEDANITATIQVPDKASLETKLRQASRDHMLRYKAIPIDPLELRKNPDISPRAAFIRKLTGSKQKTLVETRSITIPLQHDGNGFYSAILKDNTNIAGEYKVTVKCSDKKFHRIQSKQVRLRPGKIDPDKSFAEILEVRPVDKQSIWLLRAYPTDQFGNAITAPSLLRRMEVEVSGAKLVKKPEIAFDSTFQQQLTILPGQWPKAIVRIDKVKIEVRPIKPALK